MNRLLLLTLHPCPSPPLCCSTEWGRTGLRRHMLGKELLAGVCWARGVRGGGLGKPKGSALRWERCFFAKAG